MFPCLCAQGSSIAEYLDFSRIAVKRDTCVLVCLYALSRVHTPKLHLKGRGGGGGREEREAKGGRRGNLNNQNNRNN